MFCSVCCSVCCSMCCSVCCSMFCIMCCSLRFYFCCSVCLRCLLQCVSQWVFAFLLWHRVFGEWGSLFRPLHAGSKARGTRGAIPLSSSFEGTDPKWDFTRLLVLPWFWYCLKAGGTVVETEFFLTDFSFLLFVSIRLFKTFALRWRCWRSFAQHALDADIGNPSRSHAGLPNAYLMSPFGSCMFYTHQR